MTQFYTLWNDPHPENDNDILDTHMFFILTYLQTVQVKGLNSSLTAVCEGAYSRSAVVD